MAKTAIFVAVEAKPEVEIWWRPKQEAQQLLGMANRTGPAVKLSYLWELVWQPSWELDNCPDWLS